MSMSKLFRTFISIVILASMIASCAPAATPAPTQPPAQPAPTEADQPAAPQEPAEAPEATEPPAETGAAGSAGLPDLSGEELTLLIHPTLFGATGAEEGLVREFEKLTGAKVEVVTAPIPEHTEKALVEFLSSSGRYDVIAMQNSDLTSQFNQYLLPLDDYVARDAEAMEFDDIIPSLVEFGRTEYGLVGIPFRWGTNMLYYRTDLLEAAGLEPPKTLEEFVEAGKAMTKLTGDPTTSIFGIVQRGKTVELAHDWLSFYYGAGGEFMTEDGGCGFNSPEAVQTAQMFRDLFQESVLEPDIFAWGRDDYIAAMQQGRAGMGVYVSSYWGRLIDPVDSTVGDKMGWALPPTNPGVPEGRSRSGGWLLTVNRFSESPDASWELVKWLTSKENQLREAVEWANGPVRTSTFESEEYLEMFPLAKGWLTGTANSAVDPAHPAVPQIHEVIATELTAIMNDEKSAEDGMVSLCRQFDRIMGNYE